MKEVQGAHTATKQKPNKKEKKSPFMKSFKLIKNKIVCELGCAEGDNMMLLSKYAKIDDTHILNFILSKIFSKA